MHEALVPHAGRIVVYQVLGDCDAFVFDEATLDAAQGAALVANHLAAFAQNLKRRGRSTDEFAVVALLGTSMPDAVRERVDLCADHEGALLVSKATGRVFYVAGADDPRCWFVADTAAELDIRESGIDDVFAADVAFGETPTEHTGFTLAQWELGGNKRPLVMGKRRGLFGVIERVFAS